MRHPLLPARQRSFLVTVIDLLVISAVAVAAIIVFTGGGRLRVAGVRLSLRDPQRAMAWAAALAALRWMLWPRVAFVPAFHEALSVWLRNFWRGRDRERLDFVNSAGSPEHLKYYVCSLIVVCLVPLWPQLTNIRAVPDPGDPFFSVWRLAWVAHQIVSSPSHLFDANIFYPTPLTLTYSDSMLLLGFVAAPFIWAGVDPLLVANLIFVSAFPLSGVAFFLASRRLTGDLQASFIAGLLGALFPFHFEHYSHLELQFFFWIPLALIALMQVLTTPRLSAGIKLGAIFVGQCLSSMYFGIMLLTYMVPFTVAIALGWRIRPSGQLLRSFGVTALVSVVALLVLGVPYLKSRQARGERPLDVVQFYSAVPADYFETHNRSARYRLILHRHPRLERQLFPGATPLVFALLALPPPIPVPAMAAFGAGAFAADWSFGVNGLTYRQLYRWVAPYRGMRVPARFVVLVGSSLILLSAYGLRRLFHLTRSRRARTALFMVLVAAVLVDLWPHLSVRRYWSSIPSIYETVTPDMVLAEFPMRTNQNIQNIAYMYFSTAHWAKLLNGYSGFAPDHYLQLEDRMQAFPSRETLSLLRHEGATHVTVNCALYERPSQCRAALNTLDMSGEARLIANGTWEGAQVRLYQLDP